MRASPPSSTLTVPAYLLRSEPRPGGDARSATPPGRPSSSARTPAPTPAPGSWETCTLMNGTAPSKRTACRHPAGFLARAQVHPRHLGQPLLVDQPRVEGEQRLRPPGVQPGVAAIDVDGHRRVVQRREARRQQGAVQLLGRREQALDRDLVLAALVGVGICAAGRVEPHHARRQQGYRIVGPPLHGLGPGLPVGEGDGERRRVAVALQVHPVAADPQRFVDLRW